jgi:hypothetical protein
MATLYNTHVHVSKTRAASAEMIFWSNLAVDDKKEEKDHLASPI